MLIAGGLVWALLARSGVPLGVPRAAAIAVTVLLASVSAPTFRDGWQTLNDVRAESRGTSRDAARASCTSVLPNAEFLEWAAQRVPVRERFYLHAPEVDGVGQLCIRFVVLPRVQVNRPAEARFVVFWGDASRPLLGDLRRRGAIVETFEPGFMVARLP